MGSKIEALLLFGFTLVCCGGLIMLFNDAIERVTSRFWITSDFLTLMQLEWNVIGIVIFVVGIFALLLAGVGRKDRGEVFVE